MTDIEKALAMIAPSAFYEINPENVSILANAFKAAIEQHEAFRQKVSDAVEDFLMNRPTSFEQFIIPKPKPDPLVEVLNEMEKGRAKDWAQQGYADNFRAALDALGFEIREKNDEN